jgi:hypothetical protein
MAAFHASQSPLSRGNARLTLAPSEHHSLVGQERGRTIPLPDIPPYLQTAAQMLLGSVMASVCNVEERRWMAKTLWERSLSYLL